jgi:hypothetical protein
MFTKYLYCIHLSSSFWKECDKTIWKSVYGVFITPRFSGQKRALTGNAELNVTPQILIAGNYARTAERGFGRAANV